MALISVYNFLFVVRASFFYSIKKLIIGLSEDILSCLIFNISFQV